jgi:hypothetical protein
MGLFTNTISMAFSQIFLATNPFNANNLLTSNDSNIIFYSLFLHCFKCLELVYCYKKYDLFLNLYNLLQLKLFYFDLIFKNPLFFILLRLF